MATYTDNYQLTMPTYAETADIATVNHNMILIDGIMHSSQVSLADAYDSTHTYNTDDVVMYEMLMYKCLADNVTGTWDAQYWERTTASECGGGGGTASEISYDNTTSGLTADDVQEAIDELEGNIEDAVAGLEDAVESLAPAYDSTSTYNEGDIVSYENKLYECNTDNTTGTWDAQYWDEYVVSEHMGEGGSTVTITPETIAEPKQKIADFEIDGANGSLYAPIVEIEGHASGAIATFTDGGDNKPLKSLKVAINPVQSGSGDPSPSNVRPISGWSAVNVTRTGKNLFEHNSIAVYTYDFVSNNTFEDMLNPFFMKGGQTYVLTIDSGNKLYRMRAFDKNHDIITDMNKINAVSHGTSTGLTYYPSSKFYGYDGAGADNITVFRPTEDMWFDSTVQTTSPTEIMLEVGDTSTEYKPYNGQNYTIPFLDSQGNPIEVYGGSVDVVNGTSGNSANKYMLSNYSNIEFHNNQTGINAYEVYIDTTNKIAGVNNLISNIMPVKTTFSDVAEYSIRGFNNDGSIALKFPKSIISSLVQAKQWCIDNGLQILYEGTPTTFYTQPTSIKSLLGQNNIWADTGEILECVYQRDLNLVINQFDARITALEQALSRTRSLSLSKSAVKEEETKEEVKEEEETKEEQR